MEIHKPGGLYLPPSMEPKEADEAGGFRKNELFSWKGRWFKVVGILANDDMFQLAVMPAGVTKGAIKRLTGKKGVRRDRNHVSDRIARRGAKGHFKTKAEDRAPVLPGGWEDATSGGLQLQRPDGEPPVL